MLKNYTESGLIIQLAIKASQVAMNYSSVLKCRLFWETNRQMSVKKSIIREIFICKRYDDWSSHKHFLLPDHLPWGSLSPRLFAPVHLPWFAYPTPDQLSRLLYQPCTIFPAHPLPRTGLWGWVMFWGICRFDASTEYLLAALKTITKNLKFISRR